MTITCAWIREFCESEELYVVSDSRLSGNGTVWDECRKLSILPRDDAFISFAGNTDVAFPLISQLETTIMAHNSSKNRFMDIADLKGHLLHVVNSLIRSINFDGFPEKIRNEIKIDTFKNIEFLFGGYSWKQKKFQVWRIRYNKPINRFSAESMYNTKPTGNIIFAGDRKRDAIKKYYELGRLREGLDFFKNEKHFDMEPLEVIVQMLIEDSGLDSTIGGAPQIIKIYQHMNARVIGVMWPPDNPQPTVLGRKILGYENTDNIYIDPITNKTVLVPYQKNSTNNKLTAKGFKDEKS
ncbi:hypothetical protein JZO70_10290 [Enterococcus sp. 669A]|uniref:Uncharacterized protein n=1 Tax=Candidatus Enterococcus moelleringii TaxID=2815325 RepID=A0ABS3LA95_9ENTE|nr:hypothetical protein [Enterococcus sp. 669A]MBO1306553.1 hypothetical protein [Enterococcus sp. 669A]